MKIEKKAVIPDGTHIQLEDWSMVRYGKNMTIGCYPMAKRSIYNEKYPHFPPYPKRGEEFRIHLEFQSREEAEAAFENLVSGKNDIISYKKHFNGNVIRISEYMEAIDIRTYD